VRSRSDRRARLTTRTAVVLAVSLSAVAMQAGSAQAQSESPHAGEIARALQAVKADPNLATERTITTLHWKDSGAKPRANTPAWWAWITGLFAWFGQSARVLMWGAIIALVGALSALTVRLFVRRQRLPSETRFVAPTHVRDLDIRPETLPDDVGAAARELWDSGEPRAALALLYRGLLSRLAHVHQMPIRDSSTEGDCLALAAHHLAGGRREYASRLVRVWQRAVYGREQVETSIVYVLCDEFASALGSTASLANPPQGAS
jgi:hypothetical protein